MMVMVVMEEVGEKVERVVVMVLMMSFFVCVVLLGLHLALFLDRRRRAVVLLFALAVVVLDVALRLLVDDLMTELDVETQATTQQRDAHPLRLLLGHLRRRVASP